MASIINADDGVISGAAGIKLSADTSGDLNIQTNGVTAISVSASQVVSFPATTGFSIASATVTNLVATSLTVSSGSTLNGGVVINELGADADTRIEGDTDANLFFVDASTDNVGFGTNTPEYKTDTVGSTRVAETAAQNGYEVAPGSTNILTSYNRTTATWLPLRQRANQHEFYCDGVETLRLDSSGNLGLPLLPAPQAGLSPLGRRR
jgi:hypothetical protein